MHMEPADAVKAGALPATTSTAQENPDAKAP